MANKFKIQFEDGATKSASVKIKAPKDIVMFVAGTTDPINTTGLKHQANNKYWKDSLDNFWGGVKKLKPQYLDLHIEDTFFSWSGDNDTSERNKAAERLLDLFLRVYKNWTKKEVHLHLIGHSHGGNVINQFTELIAKDKKFPELWKVKSITYLSTPFFKEKHQLTHDKIHPKCKIINVHNEYDITQRFVADFTLYNLENIISTFNSEKFSKAINRIKLVISSNTYGQIFETWSVINNTNEGPLIWERTSLLLNNVGVILDEIIGCINSFKSSLSTEKEELLGVFEGLRGWATTTEAVFDGNSTNRRGGYSLSDFLDDINYLPVLQLLNQLLAIERGLDDSFLLGVLANIFTEDTGLTDSIDDTSWTPKRQVNGKYEIQDLNITIEDKYDTRNKKSNYEGFATGVEGSISNNNLREVLMRLFSQFLEAASIDSAISGINKAEYVITGNKDAQLKLLRANLTQYSILVRQYNADLIAKQDKPEEVEAEDVDSDIVFTRAARSEFDQAMLLIDNPPVKKEKKEEHEEPVPGTIPYLAMVSHGLSHTKFWKEVEDGLRNSFSSGKNPGYKG